jgi:hypothetical protein
MLMFYKEIYRHAILAGEKTDTIRVNKRLPRIGSIVQACVGPSRIFAELRITGIEAVGALAPERLAQVQACYGALPANAVRLTFEVVRSIPPKNTACVFASFESHSPAA